MCLSQWGSYWNALNPNQASVLASACRSEEMQKRLLYTVKKQSGLEKGVYRLLAGMSYYGCMGDLVVIN